MTQIPRLETSEGMHAEKVVSPGADQNVEALRMWAWFAIRQAGGTVVVPYDEFLSMPGDAKLCWKIDPATLALSIVAA